jgi:hypothetical protein
VPATFESNIMHMLAMHDGQKRSSFR